MLQTYIYLYIKKSLSSSVINILYLFKNLNSSFNISISSIIFFTLFFSFSKTFTSLSNSSFLQAISILISSEFFISYILAASSFFIVSFMIFFLLFTLFFSMFSNSRIDFSISFITFFASFSLSFNFSISPSNILFIHIMSKFTSFRFYNQQYVSFSSSISIASFILFILSISIS